MRKRLIHKNNYKIYHRPYSELNVLEKKRVAEACFRKITVCALFLVIGICFLALYRILFLPRIFLEGSRVMKIEYQGQYIEPGFLSSYQGMDLSSKVKVSGEVDTSKVGSYVRNYVATDSSGNKTKIVQKVMVFEPTKKGVIYLTFDDGPRSGTTDIILNILKEKGIKATFFVTSGGPDDLIRRAYDEGHAIGLHTASHDYSVVYSSSDSYFNDLKIVSDRVEKVTGKKSMLIRFPGGSSNTISRKYSPNIMSYLTEEVLRRGYHYYDWNIDSRDAEGGRFTADEIANFVISNLSHDKVNMVLMHDTKVVTKDALAKIIDYGKNNGYEFDKIHLFTDMVVQHVNN